MRKTVLLFLCSLILCTAVIPAEAFEFPERRRTQFSKEPGHLLIPAPYSLEGIGDGIILLGSAYNVAGTHTDIFGLVITGDIEGAGAGFTEYHIIDKRLFLDFTHQSISKAVIQSYNGRGMDTSKDDFISIDIEELTFTGARLILSFEERAYEFYLQGYEGSYDIGKLNDPDGDLIAEAGASASTHINLFSAGAMFDFTDDRDDPRQGIRLDTTLGWSPPRSSDNADYVVLDANLTLYVPVGEQSTWAFNYFSSDAFVQSKGETDRAVIEARLGFDCSYIIDPQERDECIRLTAQYIDNIITRNRRGSAESLGGRSRLRSFAEDRFSGAHTAFLGTEFRWNIAQETTPFDFKLIKDVRTGVQAAFFYEIGTVAETSGDVWQETRTSMGAGLRVVNASGLIYRIDYATGNEGEALTVIVNYPWEGF
jgi:outer membrane protein assembly factor BamA